ncbi:hypothetical protein [Enterobacter cloacae]
MIKSIIGIFPLLFIGVAHAEPKADDLQNGTYYIQDVINPKKNSNGDYILTYRSESANEIYFNVQGNKVKSYYYKSDYNWIVGRAEANYNAKDHYILVSKIVEVIHTPSDHSIIKVGDNLKGKKITQIKKEIIPVSGITANGFTIKCDQYVIENKINAFDFTDNYIISPEGGYCNRAYDDDGRLIHLEIKVAKVE